MEALVAMFATLSLAVCLMLLGFVLILQYAFVAVTYILEGKTLSAIARRRGIEKPWLAWIPVGKFWLLGCISDQYRYLVHGQNRNRRKLLLWLDILVVAVSAVFSTGVEIWAAVTLWSAAAQSPEAVMAVYMGGIPVVYLLMFLLFGVAAVVSVFQYMAYFDLFRSCDPKKSLLYLLVSIFATYPLPFFVYSCRNKDLGMPPRKDTQLPKTEASPT